MAAACALVVTACATASGQSKKDVAKANVQLGTEYLQQGRLDLALENLEKAVKADPGSATARAMIAMLYARLGRDGSADENHRLAAELVSADTPDYGMVHNNYGTYLCDHARWSDAEEHFLAAAKSRLYETPEAAYENAGLCMLKAGQVQAAEGHFRSALALKPDMARVLFHMAQIHYDTRSYLLARAFIQRREAATQIDAPGAWLGLQIEEALGDKEAVQRYALTLKGRFPDSDETKLLMKPN